MSTKKKAYQSVSEVQRAWDRATTARAAKPTVPLSFVPTRPAPLYSLMRDDTLRNTSVDWRAHPEILTKSRNLMIDALRQLNLSNESVLSAMAKVPRHVFVDDAFYLRAYDDDALPIGHGQTISHPSTVARMVSLMYGAGGLNRVLEIGTGCGYQAAVLAHCAAEVYSIERIAPLYDLAAVNLYRVQSILPTLPQIRFGDGMLGWLEAAPFDAIIIAAAGLKLPQTMLEQLRIGGILVAPVYLQANDVEQHLVRITRIGAQEWQREVIDVARFVPLLGGVETRG